MKDCVIEGCSNCMNEVELQWDIFNDGYAVFCPFCGQKLMLCSECPDSERCDWDSDTECCSQKTNIWH